MRLTLMTFAERVPGVNSSGVTILREWRAAEAPALAAVSPDHGEFDPCQIAELTQASTRARQRRPRARDARLDPTVDAAEKVA